MGVTLDVADALALISERAGRRAESSIAAVLALIFTSWDSRGRRDGYPKGTIATSRHCGNHGVGRRINDIDRLIAAIVGHVGARLRLRRVHPGAQTANEHQQPRGCESEPSRW